MYKPHFFSLEELVPPEIFKKYGDRAWEFFDERVLKTLDVLRIFFNVPMTVNNWKWGKSRKYSGYRPADCKIGAANSQHRHGRAIDLICKIPAAEMRLKIIENHLLFPYISVLEDDVDWLHFDVRYRDGDGIKLIKP